MKELYRKDKWAMAIYDNDNYVIYDHTKPMVDKKTGKVRHKYRYFSQPQHAIRELSRLLANEACTDLKTWVDALVGYQDELESLLTGKAA